MKVFAILFGAVSLAVGLGITTAVLAPPSQGWVGVAALPITYLIWRFVIEPRYEHLWDPDAE